LLWRKPLQAAGAAKARLLQALSTAVAARWGDLVSGGEKTVENGRSGNRVVM